jgi:hypothetical protein
VKDAKTLKTKFNEVYQWLIGSCTSGRRPEVAAVSA